LLKDAQIPGRLDAQAPTFCM